MQLKPYERYNLIDTIASKLRNDFNTRSINHLLANYGIETDTVSIVPSKHQYVTDLLNKESDNLITKLADDLELETPNKSIRIILDFTDLLKSNQLHSVIDDFNRAYKNVEADPEIAITSASSTLESICKAVCDFFNESYPTDESMRPLICKAYKLLKLSPDQHADEQIKKILGGLNSVATGIGALRTKNSAAHGHGMKKLRLSQRHSRLVVNSCATIGIFILETYYDNFLTKQ